MYAFKYTKGEFDKFVSKILSGNRSKRLNRWWAYSDNIYVIMKFNKKWYWLSFDLSSAEVSSTTQFVASAYKAIDHYVQTGNLPIPIANDPLDISFNG